MSSIVTSILSSTLGLLWNNVIDWTVEKPKGGDVTDAKTREFLAKELNEMKTKLGLSSEDLLSSYTYLQEGVDVLNVALNESNLDEKALRNETKDDGGETSTMLSTVGSYTLREVLELSHSIEKMKLDSNKELESAKERFEDARRKATEAFCNEALSIKDRIFAAKLRTVSEILEYLHNPENAIEGCMSFLKKLHSLPAIQEMFNVYISNEEMEPLNKDERLENVKSIMLINCHLYDYVLKLSAKNPVLQCWPRIELADRGFHPILNEWTLISDRTSMGKELNQHRSKVELDEHYNPAVNSRSEVIVKGSANSIKVISRTGESKTVELPDPKEFHVTKHWDVALAVDKNDKVYVMITVEAQKEHGHDHIVALCILDANYNVMHTCLLDFLMVSLGTITMVINKNNEVIVVEKDWPYVYICDDVGQLKHKFETTYFDSIPFLSISERNEIITSYFESQEVRIFTEEGNLKSTIKLPKDHSVLGVAFHHVLSKIIVSTYKHHAYERSHKNFLLIYSESGDLETTTCLCKSTDIYLTEFSISSHPSGPFVLLADKSIMYI